MSDYRLSLWPLTEDEEFADSVPAWESEPLDREQAEGAYEDFSLWIALALIGSAPAYNLSLDKPDRDGIGICQEIRTLR